MFGLTNNTSIRRYVRIVVFGVLGFAIGALVMSRILFFIDIQQYNKISVEDVIQNTVATTSVSLPVYLRIPSVGINTYFEAPLGIQSNNEIEIPKSYEKVAWYKYGPTPGEIGPAVILGHVDSYKGPAVFFPLKKVKVGDIIEIGKADGSVLEFEVTSTEINKQAGFPTEKVYSDIDYAGLRLVTCAGTYDRGMLRYTHNLIVYAKLIS